MNEYEEFDDCDKLSLSFVENQFMIILIPRAEQSFRVNSTI